MADNKNIAVEPVVQTDIPDVTPRPVDEDGGVGFGLNEKGEFSASPTLNIPASTQQPAQIVPAAIQPAPVQPATPLMQQPAPSSDIAYQLEQGRQAQQTLATLFRDHGERIIPLLRGEIPNATNVHTAQMEQRNAALEAKCKELWGDTGPEVAEYVRNLSKQMASEELAQALGPVQQQVQQLNAYYVQQQCRDVASNWREQLVSTYRFPQSEADDVIRDIVSHPSMRGASPEQLHNTIQTVLLQYLPNRPTAQASPAAVPQIQPVQIPTTRVAATLAPSAPMQDMRRQSALVTGTGAAGDGMQPTDQRAMEIAALRDSQRYRNL